MLLTAIVNAQKPIDQLIAQFNDGAAKINSGDFKAAITDFEGVITMAEKLGPDANDLRNKAQTQLPVLYYQVANACMKDKKYDEAIPHLKKCIELADVYKNNQDTKAKAVKYLPALLTGVGNQKYKDNDLTGAMQDFNEALSYDGSYLKAIFGKGLVYADQMKEKEMIETLSKAIELANAAGDTKTVEQAKIKMGLFYINRGNQDLADVDPEDEDFTPAIESFEKAISYNPAASDAYYMLSMIWNKNNEFDKAIENAKKGLESETDANKIAALNYELGNAFFGNAEYELACEALNKAMVGSFSEKAQAKKEKVPGCE
jgi:tetratricopeptide (TPR) repeat protein